MKLIDITRFVELKTCSVVKEFYFTFFVHKYYKFSYLWLYLRYSLLMIVNELGFLLIFVLLICLYRQNLLEPLLHWASSIILIYYTIPN